MCTSFSRHPHFVATIWEARGFLFVLVMPNTTVCYGIQKHDEYFSTKRSLGCFAICMHVCNRVCRHSCILWCGGQRLISVSVTYPFLYWGRISCCTQSSLNGLVLCTGLFWVILSLLWALGLWEGCHNHVEFPWVMGIWASSQLCRCFTYRVIQQILCIPQVTRGLILMNT